MSNTKRIAGDVPAQIAIDFKVAVIQHPDRIKVYDALAEALQMWTEAQMKAQQSKDQLKEGAN